MKKNDFSKERRQFLRLAGPIGIMLAAPVYAFDFGDLQKKLQSKDMEKTKSILQGAGSILASTQDIDYQTEFTIGESLALEGFRRYGLPVENKKIQKYVNIVGNAVARNSSRPKIPFYFVVVESPLYNAFACPGGIIFVSSALLKLMESEAELAGVLAHEVGHVCRKHALQSIKRAKFFEGVGKISAATMEGEDGKKFQDMIGGLQSVLFDKGLDKNMEYEADLTGIRIAYRTGYNPNGLIKVLKMLKKKEATSSKQGSWFSTHPPLSTRINKCREKVQKYSDASTLANVTKRFMDHKKLL